MLSYRIALSRCAYGKQQEKKNTLKCSVCEEGKKRNLIF